MPKRKANISPPQEAENGVLAQIPQHNPELVSALAQVLTSENSTIFKGLITNKSEEVINPIFKAMCSSSILLNIISNIKNEEFKKEIINFKVQTLNKLAFSISEKPLSMKRDIDESIETHRLTERTSDIELGITAVIQKIIKENNVAALKFLIELEPEQLMDGILYSYLILDIVGIQNEELRSVFNNFIGQYLTHKHILSIYKNNNAWIHIIFMHFPLTLKLFTENPQPLKTYLHYFAGIPATQLVFDFIPHLNVNAHDLNGDTAYHIAGRNKIGFTMKLLEAAGADITIRNRQGKTGKQLFEEETHKKQKTAVLKPLRNSSEQTSILPAYTKKKNNINSLVTASPASSLDSSWDSSMATMDLL